MLKTFMLLAAATLIGVAPLPAPTHAVGPMPQEAAPATATTNPVKPTAASQERAKKLFEVDCAMCHGLSGDGKTDLAKDMQLTLGDWTDPKTLANKPDQELFNAIRNGKDKMPPEAEGRAKNDDVWNLIIYIRNMSKGQPPAPTASAPPSK